jgi:superfamily I DNA/RNA helicase
LNTDGFENDDIVILSTRSDTSSISSRIDTEPWKNRLRPFNAARKGNLRYGSVHAFKGMEAPAVIVTDVDRITDQAASSLFYVAITRAVDRLVVLVDDSVREDIVKALI